MCIPPPPQFDRIGNVRKISRCFLVLGLFFGQEPGQGDNVRVDLFRPRADVGFAIRPVGAVAGHGGREVTERSGRIVRTRTREWGEKYSGTASAFRKREMMSDGSSYLTGFISTLHTGGKESVSSVSNLWPPFGAGQKPASLSSEGIQFHTRLARVMKALPAS